MPRDDPDRSLVERIQGGDEEAFNEIMGRYKRPVLGFAYRLLGHAAEAEDVAQETFVRVYRSIGKYRAGTALFSTWLFQLARNAAIDHLRQRARRREEPLEKADFSAATAPTAATQTEAREIGDRVAAAVAGLPEDQRTAFVLAEYHGLSYAAISDIMRCSEKSVESRLYRAKQFLRLKLADLMR